MSDDDDFYDEDILDDVIDDDLDIDIPSPTKTATPSHYKTYLFLVKGYTFDLFLYKCI